MGTSEQETSQQVAAEQAAVTGMYRRLDAEVDAAAGELAEVLASRSAEREAMAALLRRRLRDLRAAESGLCFGRIDHGDGTTLHIGRRGLRVNGETLLVDWRAPAAAPFYAATAARPMGLRRRRHLRLDGRTVRGVSDEILDGSAPGAGDILGDGPLVAALSAHRTGRMRDAVATLQAEQDAVVRSPARGITVVQGGPGTGKTVVALHRAAYVLFAHPPAARGVLVVGPDARFLDYISQVLPSLGEQDVRLATRTGVAGADPAWSAGAEPDGLADTEPARVAGGEPDGVAGERAGLVGLPDPPELARLAGRGELAEALAAWVRARRPVPAAVAVRAGPDTIELDTTEALAAAAGLPHNRGRRVFRDYLAAELVRARARVMADQLARIDAETAAATGLDLDAAVAADLRSLGLEAGPASALEAELDPRAALTIDDAIWPELTAAEVVDGLLADPPPGFAALRREPGTPWRRAYLALLDEAAALVDGPPADVYGHIVVDEAQELTVMDWRVVMRRCPSRSMTVVGDFAQAGPVSTCTSWREALGGRFELHTLTVNYRTTAEILESTRDLLAEIAPEQQLSRSLRHGEPPRARTVAAAGLVAAVLDELGPPDGGLAAVICADDRLAGTAVERRARLVPVAEARGLEFDTVVVVDPDGMPPRDRYVALTRSTHRLSVLSVLSSGR